MKLPSGRELQVTLSPFKISKTLFQAMLDELRVMEVNPDTNIDTNFWKNAFCAGFSSKKVEICLNECFERAIIDKVKVGDDSFEKVEHRDDYLAVCLEVARVNVSPFTKTLFAEFSLFTEKMQSFLQSKFQKTP